MELRREKLSLSYSIRLKGRGEENPTKISLQNCWECDKLERNGFGWTLKGRARKYGLESIEFTRTSPISNIPPWLYPATEVDINIKEKKRENGKRMKWVTKLVYI